jgi:hypothetical protein
MERIEMLYLLSYTVREENMEAFQPFLQVRDGYWRRL